MGVQSCWTVYCVIIKYCIIIYKYCQSWHLQRNWVRSISLFLFILCFIALYTATVGQMWKIQLNGPVVLVVWKSYIQIVVLQRFTDNRSIFHNVTFSVIYFLLLLFCFLFEPEYDTSWLLLLSLYCVFKLMLCTIWHRKLHVSIFKVLDFKILDISNVILDVRHFIIIF